MPARQSDIGIAAALDEVFAPWNRGDAPGLAVGVAHRGEVVYRRGFGLASVEAGVANHSTMRMRIGSTTKQFTALAAMLLAEDGRLDVDADIRDVLPELPEFGRTITPRHLMRHTAGLRCHVDLWMLTSGTAAYLPDGEPFDQLKRIRSLNFAPGERMIYCNGGYVLLSHIVERVAGRPLDEVLADRIFRPLGMDDTELMRRDGDIVPRNAILHVKLPTGRFVRGQMMVPLAGDGGIVSTVDDMLIWLRHLGAPVIGTAATWAAMRERPAFTDGALGDYGLGLISRRYRGVTTLGHAGAVIGGMSELIAVPEHDLDITILANRSDANVAVLARKVIDAVLADVLEPPPARPSAEQFVGFAGTYHQPGGGQVFRLGTEGDVPVAEYVGVKTPLAIGMGGELMCSSSTADILFRAGEQGPGGVATLDVIECGIVQPFRRLDAPPDATAAGAPAIAGAYRNDEVPIEADIVVAGGSVTLALQGQYGRVRYVLTPLAVDLWSVAYTDGALPYRHVLEVERRDGRVTAVHLSSARTRRLALARVDPATPTPLRPGGAVDATT